MDVLMQLFWKKINWRKGKGNYERSGKNGLTNLGPEREQWTFTEHLRGWRLNIINTEAVPGLIAGRAQGGVTLLIEILPLRGSSNCKSKSSFNTSLTAIWFHKSKSITLSILTSQLKKKFVLNMFVFGWYKNVSLMHSLHQWFPAYSSLSTRWNSRQLVLPFNILYNHKNHLFTRI